MSDNWIVQNLQNALDLWNARLAEMWSLLTLSPQEFREGRIWAVILTVHGAMRDIGLSLLVLFFVAGALKTAGSMAELKRPEQALRLFVRFAAAKGMVTWGMDLLLRGFEIGQGIVGRILAASGMGAAGQIRLPDELVAAVEQTGFLESIPLWAVSLLGSLFMTAASFLLILTVYGRFFRMYLYAAVAPVPLAGLAGEPTQRMGISFLRSFCGVLLEGAVLILAAVIYGAYAASPPVLNAGAAPVAQVWTYIGELIFNMLILVYTVRGADRIVREMMLS